MLFKFLGGAQEVGRSSILMRERGGSSLLLDCGVKLADKPEYPIEVPNVDAFILSHAHIDHSGAAPTIYGEQMVPAFGTQPTLDFSELLLEDSLQIARKEHLQERFHKRQIKSFMNRYVPMNYGRAVDFRDMEITMHDAGHISGSAITLVERKHAQSNRRIVYTGDYKIEPQFLHKGAEFIESDILVTESTCSLRGHPNREETVSKIIEKIREVLESGGNVLLPSFAVGRAQEMLVMLYKNGLIEQTYVDGMARQATRIALRYKGFVTDWESLNAAAHKAVFVESIADRLDALSKPSVILTTAGMLNGGPAIGYIKKLNGRSEILLTGYQVEGTNGRMLLERGAIRDGGHEIRVHATATYFDLSAHAGREELFGYVKRSKPSTVICVHGDEQASTSMAEALKLEGYEAYAPKIGETIKLY